MISSNYFLCVGVSWFGMRVDLTLEWYWGEEFLIKGLESYVRFSDLDDEEMTVEGSDHYEFGFNHYAEASFKN